MRERDYYEVLGVENGASADDLKSAYRKIALKYHPDRNQGDADAESKFKEAAEAYAVLGDDEKRQRYDQFGHAGVNGQAGFGGGGGFSVDDIFSAFGDIFGGRGGSTTSFGGFSFDELFSGRRGGRRGASLRVDLAVTLEEVSKGVEKEIEVTRLDTCDSCNGSGAKAGTRPESCSMCGGGGEVQQSQGFFAIRRTCPTCQGRGQVVKSPCPSCRGAGATRKREAKKIRIPPGIEEGHVERLPGQGEAGEAGAPPGDLVLVIHVEDHSLFERHGPDLLCDVPIRYGQAALGASIQVQTLTGQVEMKIPKGTQPGQILRLRGQGLPRGDGRGNGSLLVRVSVDVPKKLTAREGELMTELDEIQAKRRGASGTTPRDADDKGKGLFEKIKDIF